MYGAAVSAVSLEDVSDLVRCLHASDRIITAQIEGLKEVIEAGAHR